MKLHSLCFALLLNLACLDDSSQQVAAQDTATAEHAVDDSASALDTDAKNATESSDDSQSSEAKAEVPVQSGPFIDLFGPQLYSLQLMEQNQAKMEAHYTNEILAGKKVVGLYFSADWCGPCRQFTPELVSFYEKMNTRRGKKDQFQIVWISRCRDSNSYVQYFAQMPWLALPPEEAMGARGQMLGDKYKVKGIPSLVLLDDLGQVITIDARNKIPQDKAGIGFPWRSPFAQLYTTIIPRSLRLMVQSQIDGAKTKVVEKVKSLVGKKTKTPPVSA